MTKFNCIHCSYETESSSAWNRHITTKKHLKNVGGEDDVIVTTPKISRDELVKQCKVYGIKNVSSKTKEELIKMLEHPYSHIFTYDVLVELVTKQEKSSLVKTCIELGFKSVETKSKKVLLSIIEHPELYRFSTEVLSQLTAMKNTNYCIQCKVVAHTINSCSKLCRVKDVMIGYLIDNNILQGDVMIEHFENLSKLTGMSQRIIEKLYPLLDCVKLANCDFQIDTYFENINHLVQECHECKQQIYDIQQNTTMMRKGNILCSPCWSKYKHERDEAWVKVDEYHPHLCVICFKRKGHEDERFHYDHKNMFDKTNSICVMVNEGCEIAEIYKELDKCQSMCLQCHHMVTDIERKIGFTSVKLRLTRNLSSNTISQETHDAEMEIYKKIYSSKMNKIYNQLRSKIK
jgi:hypothetical protein